MRLVLLLATALLAPLPAAADAPPPPDLRPLAGRLAAEVVRPGYAALTRAARADAEAWRAECARPTPSREILAARHRDLAEAWWRVEVIRFGPIAEDFRAERLNFWPDRRNATTRGVAALLDPATPAPTPATVQASSAAAQGIPALERIVFDGKRPLSPRDCAAGAAVAANVQSIAEAVEAGWAPLADQVATDDAVAREMVARLVTDLLTGFQTLIDGKLAALGKTIDAARPDGLEGRRAGLEVAALARPLDGMARMAAVLVDDRADGATALATLDTARSIAEGLPPAVGPLLADPRRRSQVVLLRDALRSAQETALDDLPALVGITVGFNSRDGD